MNTVRCEVTTQRIEAASAAVQTNNPSANERRTELIVRTNLINLQAASVAQRLCSVAHAHGLRGGYQQPSSTTVVCSTSGGLLGFSQGWFNGTR
jgi:hypothetical protein